MNDMPSLHRLDTPVSGQELHPDNLLFAETLLERYREDPESVPPAWADYFRSLEGARRRERRRRSSDRPDLAHEQLQIRVLQFINSYRYLGHFGARLDPLEREAPEPPVELSREYHGLDRVGPDILFDPGSLFIEGPVSLDTIERVLRETYCATIGAEYMHIAATEEKRWLQERLESAHGHFDFNDDTRLAILERLVAAEGLERYLHRRYVGQKRFSLEGAESLIPLLNALVQRGGARGLQEIVLGMAHRGRLNVLVNLFGKAPSELAGEFEGRPRDDRGTGDVKYHMGFSSGVETPGGPVHLALAFNPSHLEIVTPVVEGSVRARQVRIGDRKGNRVMPVVIHGDAAFAGQGVVMETLNMSQTRGFSTKGTVHVVVNNQIGFTTSTLKDARSTHYATDVAKMVNAPILHVNGDDPEAVVFVTQVALDYRMRFGKDVVIDLVCYRRQGHNEADEPAATQPHMYRHIRDLPTTRELYARTLIEAGLTDEQSQDDEMESYRGRLDAGEPVALSLHQNGHGTTTNWEPYLHQTWDQDVETGVPADRLSRMLDQLSTPPEDFQVHPRVQKVLDARRAMAAGEQPLDWGAAETLAYGALIQDGYRIRLSGQDSGRGTFFHRHAVLHDQETGKSLVPLRRLDPDHPRFLIIDSLLSEEGVLAFEYGYATAAPEALVIWEAQFGDFVNGAQVVIDQFISSGEQKWGRLCGLTLLLPHGYEGQGPEHSSARPERFLQLAAQENMQVCVPTTPAQIFHLLRRQMVRPYRKPLVVMTPKSLLRHQEAVSDLDALANGQYQTVIDDARIKDPDAVKRVLLTSGRIYYDLAASQSEGDHWDVAILRLEQCYPFPEARLTELLGRYPHAEEFVWVQDEPENQGYLEFVAPRINPMLAVRGQTLHAVARPPAAAPAVGYPEVHKAQLKDLLDRAFGPISSRDTPHPTP
ncbi:MULTISPECIES: 2-oxoglutarate dehydrogenase E1 component [unclassified Thioalkalivibrio]|uniref:2-oxoglutarate dehydrogenase E1 component n=1 Tax=unclassified Thioalkalivibrio TaxID=2621013 RepID=UPI00037EB44D|nr:MULTISPECIES: 2-oxoglutarate dehydrogenase E1 component [unclassified Thioalkalivibrio]